ncbi:MAG TPA: DoxX family protein [Alphaproteobacteria bacterium]|jgi:putative oxidoreductase|nr:DoxX family protein [Alphaproteobacteria bacterium]
MQSHAGALAQTASPLRLFRQGIDVLGHVPESLLLVLARFSVGAVFFKSGLVKIASWTATVQLFAFEYQVPLLPPELAARLASTVELTAPVLLFLGFGARFAAAAMLAMVFVIQVFVYPANWAEHLTWTALLLFILTRGAGALSLDHLIARRLGN